MHRIIKFGRLNSVTAGSLSPPARYYTRTPGWIGARMSPTHTIRDEVGIISFPAVDSFITKQIVAGARSRPYDPAHTRPYMSLIWLSTERGPVELRREKRLHNRSKSFDHTKAYQSPRNADNCDFFSSSFPSKKL